MTEQAYSIKDLLYGRKENFFLEGPKREILSGSYLACSGSQSERRIRPILPARGFSRVIKIKIVVNFSGYERVSNSDTMLRMDVSMFQHMFSFHRFKKSSTVESWANCHRISFPWHVNLHGLKCISIWYMQHKDTTVLCMLAAHTAKW